jgi:arylsulfatase A-like enzyme
MTMKLRKRGGEAGTTTSSDRSGGHLPSALWQAFWLAVVLVGTKAFYLGWRAANPPSNCLGYLGALAAISYADVLYAVGLGLLHRAALSRRLAAPAHRMLDGLFRFAYLLSALYAVVDLEVFAYFLTPLTYPLISLSGDLATFATSIAPSLTPSLVIVGVSCLLLLTQLVAVSQSLAARASPSQRRIARRILTVAAVSWVSYGRYHLAIAWNDRIDRRIAESPHVTFVSSLLRAWAGGDGSIVLAEPAADRNLEDFLTVAERRRQPLAAGLLQNASVDIVRPVHPGKVRNVVLVVLESVSARWLELYGSPYHATPTLSEEARHALVFSNLYSTAGRSADALVSILLSIQPRMSYRSLTSDFPQLPGETLAEELKTRGYRTAFLTSSDLGWENWRGFLADRGFDSIVQGSDLDCGEPLTSWGVEDRCLMDGMIRWITDDPHRPFFLMAWTVQTHHPYEPTPGRPQLDFFGDHRPADDYDLGRYLNALSETDRQLGRLFVTLRHRHLDDDTLVVVVGDHGEAFGAPHEAYGHGTTLYEENVHVPMLLWSPRLFPRGGHSPIVGSQVDLNQTIVDILGIPTAASWQGRSLFDPARGPRVYFFVANDNYQMGVREDRWKYILDVTNGREELYDLRTDQEEQRNVAAANPEVCKRLRQRLAARAEADRRFKLFSDSS